MELENATYNILGPNSDVLESKQLNIIIISDSQKYTITLINYVYFCSFVSVFGVIVNIVNLKIFHRQGLNTTINISFFSLAVSDLCSLLFQLMSNIFVNPWFVSLNLPMVYSGVQFVTTRIARVLFTRVTFFITVYITAERCLCITFPLHIKQIITPRRTIIILVSIYILTLVSLLPLYSTVYLTWTFHSGRRKTLLSVGFRHFKTTTIPASYCLQAIVGVLAFLAIVILTLTLVYKLSKKNEWLQTATVQHEKSQPISRRERATVKMVVLISALLILCYTPSVFLCLTTFLEPEFTESGRYSNIYSSLWSVAMLMENINSSVNIFFYFKMSSRYRQTFRELFFKCLHIKADKSERTN